MARRGGAPAARARAREQARPAAARRPRASRSYGARSRRARRGRGARGSGGRSRPRRPRACGGRRRRSPGRLGGGRARGPGTRARSRAGVEGSARGPRRRGAPVPESGRWRPAITRSNVLFPDPLGPRTATTSPVADVERDAVQRGRLPEPHADVLDREHQIQPPSARRRIRSTRKTEATVTPMRITASA